jgi:predicted dehydrogenase
VRCARRGDSSQPGSNDRAQVVGTLDELVNHPEADLVVVLNTAPQHAYTVCNALAAGKQAARQRSSRALRESARHASRLR